jgi:uncharacterized membrane protein YkvA (DUF1232 family)
MITVECPKCGVLNKVDLERLKIATCGSCKEKLIEDDIPDSISNEDIGETVNAAWAKPEVSDIEVSRWIAKIGNQEQQNEYVEKGFWSKVKKYASKVPFSRNAVAMYYCATDPSTPLTAKAVAIGALAYWILPIDVIPDFIPVAGFADDATAILIAYNAMSSHIKEEHHKKADEFFAE